MCTVNCNSSILENEIEYYRKNIPDEIKNFSFDGREALIEYIKLLRKYGSCPVHTDWALDFYESVYYQKSNSSKYYRNILEKHDDNWFEKWCELSSDHIKKIAEYEAPIFEKYHKGEEIDYEKVLVGSLPIMKETWSLFMNMFKGTYQNLSRFEVARIYKDPLQSDNFKILLEVDDIIRNYLKTKQLNLKPEQEYLRERYHVCLGTMWGFAEACIGEYILPIIDNFLEFDKICFEENWDDEFFKYDLSKSGPRKRMSLLILKSTIYNQMGLIEKRKQVLKELVDMHYSVDNGRHINYYVGINRLIESALCLYKLEPSEKLKEIILKYWCSMPGPNTHEHKETPRERALVTFQIAKTFGYEYSS